MSRASEDKMPAGTTAGTPQVLLAHHLKQLKLPTVLREYEKLARECARDGIDHSRYLLRLIELELIDRERRTVERRIRAARFPAVKSIDTFDFTAIPSLNKMLVLELARGEYILRRENIIALGNSGTGKTHVALALGLAACQKGFTVAFTTAAALVNQLMEARDEKRLLKMQRDLAAVIGRQIEPGGPALDARQRDLLDRIKADGADMDRLGHGEGHHLHRDRLEQAQDLDKFAFALVPHAGFEKVTQMLERLGQGPVL